jgi:N-acetylneuraminic acid mutarotase
VVNALAVGSTRITATLNGLSQFIDITVSPVGGGIATNSKLTYARYEQTADILFKGTSKESVLVAGGYGITIDGTTGSLNTAELYDPSTDTWKLTGSMTDPRTDHTSTQLLNGKVLVIGGNLVMGNNNPNYTSTNGIRSTELYDPDTGVWQRADSMLTGRSYHASTLLVDGTVLAAGGDADVSTSERYYPNENNGSLIGRWKSTGKLNFPRSSHTATMLSNSTQPLYGKVLVTGGFFTSPSDPAHLGMTYSSCELYDPSTGLWEMTGSLNVGRFLHTATLLPDGKILVVGGYTRINLADELVSTAELFDPVTAAWSPAGTLSTPRASHTATLLPDGRVLVMGGESALGTENKSTELYDPATKTWTTSGDMITARDVFTASLLSNKKVLVVGGTDEASKAIAFDSSELIWY